MRFISKCRHQRQILLTTCCCSMQNLVKDIPFLSNTTIDKLLYHRLHFSFVFVAYCSDIYYSDFIILTLKGFNSVLGRRVFRWTFGARAMRGHNGLDAYSARFYWQKSKGRFACCPSFLVLLETLHRFQREGREMKTKILSQNCWLLEGYYFL